MPQKPKAQEISTQVTEVTVYQDRAIVTRSGPLALQNGKSTVLLTQLPDNLDEDSLRVTGRGRASVVIEDFKIQRRHFRDIPEEQAQTLWERREELLERKQELLDASAVIGQQEEFLHGINTQSAETISQDFQRKSPSIAEWREVLRFLGEEGGDLKEKARKKALEIKECEKEIQLIDQALKGFSNAQQKVRKQVQVDITVLAEGEFSFEVSYMVYNASWKPLYDARVDAKTKEVQLRYYGAVSQHTGEAWEQVKVMLSTARPHIGGNAPELQAWNIQAYQPSRVYPQMDEVSASAPAGGAPASPKKKSRMRMESASFSAMEEEAMPMAEMASAEVIGGEGASVVFSPGGRSDVPGDGSVGKLLLLESPFGAEFQYTAIPKLSPHVYLGAKVRNDSEFPLLPGPIAIFLDGSYVGKSHLTELVTPGEKFDLSLGVDEAIKVKHQLKRQFGDEKGLFHKSKTTQYAYQIDLDNQHDRAESVTVQDQVPVSLEEDIKVKLDRVSPAENPEKEGEKLPSGALEWKIELGAREKATIEFAFTVSHGRDTIVSGL